MEERKKEEEKEEVRRKAAGNEGVEKTKEGRFAWGKGRQ